MPHGGYLFVVYIKRAGVMLRRGGLSDTQYEDSPYGANTIFYLFFLQTDSPDGAILDII